MDKNNHFGCLRSRKKISWDDSSCSGHYYHRFCWFVPKDLPN